MLGIMINNSFPWLPGGSWKLWVKYIMGKEPFRFRKAALIHFNGNPASSTPGFTPLPREILRLNECFEGVGKSRDRISIQGKTYIIKYADEDQIIAFNGSKYFIISRSKSMLIIVLCISKTKYEEAAEWIKKVAGKLIDKNL